MFTTWDEAVEAFDALLDSLQVEVRVSDYSWAPSDVLRQMDPTAYRCGLFDFIDAEGVDSDTLDGTMQNVP